MERPGHIKSPHRIQKISRPRVPMLALGAVNRRWSMDFMSDQLANGRRFWALNVVDDSSREYCLDFYWFASIDDPRAEIDYWHHHYNHV